MSLQQQLQLAAEHHRAGRFAQAEAIYRQVLAQQPDNADALHLLGMLAFQNNHADIGMQLIRRAIAIKPTVADYHMNLGNILGTSGRMEDAVACDRTAANLDPESPDARYNLALHLAALGRNEQAVAQYRRLLESHPDHSLAWNNLGNLMQVLTQSQEAISCLQRAIQIQPNYPDAFYNLGLVYFSRKDYTLAAENFRKALAMQPDFAEAYDHLGMALAKLGDLDAAIAAHSNALALRPHSVRTHNNLGVAYMQSGQLVQAISSYRHALAIDPNDAMVLGNLGTALMESYRFSEALEAFNKSVELKPNLVTVRFHLGKLYSLMDDLDNATDAFEQALALEPDHSPSLNLLAYTHFLRGDMPGAMERWGKLFEAHPDYAPAHQSQALALLTVGDYRRGFEEFDWRLKVPPGQEPDFTQPKWNGEDLTGKRIHLHAEQAFGDTLFFARYIPLVAERGGHVIFSCFPPLIPLLRDIQGVSEFVAPGEMLPPFELHCALPSLPRVFQTDPQNVPADIPYVHADQKRVEYFKSRVGDETKLKIGLCWAGRPFPINRSVPPELLSPLAEISSVQFYSLQKTDATVPTSAPPGVSLVDWTADLHDFGETAALIENLDLVITIDTSIAHLAGAMGKKTWVLLKRVPDWRWGLNRPDCPWYPTIRVFRQPQFGDWQTPINQMLDALREWSATPGKASVLE